VERRTLDLGATSSIIISESLWIFSRGEMEIREEGKRKNGKERKRNRDFQSKTIETPRGSVVTNLCVEISRNQGQEDKNSRK